MLSGIALMPEAGGKLTIFIADFYNETVRAVGPDGIMRSISDEGRVAFGTPTRVALGMGEESVAALREVGKLLAFLKEPEPPTTRLLLSWQSFSVSVA